MDAACALTPSASGARPCLQDQPQQVPMANRRFELPPHLGLTRRNAAPGLRHSHALILSLQAIVPDHVTMNAWTQPDSA